MSKTCEWVIMKGKRGREETGLFPVLNTTTHPYPLRPPTLPCVAICYKAALSLPFLCFVVVFLLSVVSHWAVKGRHSYDSTSNLTPDSATQ